MKTLFATIVGVPVTLIGCFLFSGGPIPVERFLYRAFSHSYGFDLLIWMPLCLVVGYVVLEAVGYES